MLSNAVRPAVVHADEYVELKSFGEVQRLLETQCPFQERWQLVREAVVISK